jgi:hypothetical protein
MLQVAVPMEIHRMRRHTVDQRIDTAHECGQIIAQHGDDLMYGGPHCSEAFVAMARGLAALALTAQGGVTWYGIHWCRDVWCPGPDADHPVPPPLPEQRPRSIETITAALLGAGDA